MFLVQIPAGHPVQWLFVEHDPRPYGCPFPIVEHVEYSDEASRCVDSLENADTKRFVLGRLKSDPNKFKRFIKNGSTIEPEYERLAGSALALSSWTVYASVCSVNYTTHQRAEPVSALE